VNLHTALKKAKANRSGLPKPITKGSKKITKWRVWAHCIGLYPNASMKAKCTLTWDTALAHSHGQMARVSKVGSWRTRGKGSASSNKAMAGCSKASGSMTTNTGVRTWDNRMAKWLRHGTSRVRNAHANSSIVASKAISMKITSWRMQGTLPLISKRF